MGTGSKPPSKRRGAPTIADVARKAGVGIGTVSRVINNSPAVRPETRAKVQAVMEELGYVPNPHARRIAGGRSYTVSVLLPFVGTEFYLRLIEGIEEELGAQRYDLALFPLLSRKRLERFLNSSALAYHTDGLIVASYDLSERFPGGRLPTDRPVVMVDARSRAYDSAYLDNALGGRMAAEHLLELGGPIFAVQIEEELDRVFASTVFSSRLGGFREALAAAGRPLASEHLYRTRLSAEGGQMALQRFLSLAGPPLNVFAAADVVALGVAEEAERRGLVVGRDVRVLGFDGQPWTAERGLSTLEQPVEAMGRVAARMLIERLQGAQPEPRQHRFEPKLRIRASTRP
ncbi:LacI family DNA-binding transcriptional regulator [Oceanithermus sp.]